MDYLELKCNVEKGMFSNEVQVTFDTGYDQIQTLVSEDFIHNGKVVLKIDSESEDDIHVLVPGDIIKGNRYIKIKRKIAEVSLISKEII
jgi:hypothetical protein